MFCFIFLLKQKSAYEMRISDWSSDVCSSDLLCFALGLRRPFLLVLVYVYIDIVSPQRVSYFLLNSIPISAIAFVLAVLAWLLMDEKRGIRLSIRQVLMVTLLGYCG